MLIYADKFLSALIRVRLRSNRQSAFIREPEPCRVLVRLDFKVLKVGVSLAAPP